MTSITIIACVDSKGNIGYKNDLLFKIKEDLQQFKNKTIGNICVFGRLTFESILQLNGKPLSGRTNVVLSRDKGYTPQHSEIVFHDIESIIKVVKSMTEDDKEVFVCGGSIVYDLLLKDKHVDKIVLTVVDKVADKSDTKFPMHYINETDFKLDHYEKHYSDKYECFYSFNTYIRNEK